MRRGQVSIFIIIGIIVVIGSALVLMNLPDEAPEQVPQMVFGDHMVQIKNFIQSCLETSAEDSARYMLGKGNIQPSYEFYETDELKVAYFYYENDTVPPTLQEWESQLKTLSSLALTGCADLSSYEEMGFKLTPSPYNINVKILDESVIFDLSYPLKVQIGDMEGSIDKFNYELPFRLKHLNNIAHNFSNEIAVMPFGVPLYYLNAFDVEITYTPMG
ncbi:MAG: hypothetical protein ACE5FT_06065, partial [Candidatus Nanoarchaeia archaeon]